MYSMEAIGGDTGVRVEFLYMNMRKDRVKSDARILGDRNMN